MITIKNVKMLDGSVRDYTMASSGDSLIEAHKKLLLLPALVDPHIYLGPSTQQQWALSLHSAIRGGITSFIESPHVECPCDTKENLEEKRKIIDKNLKGLDFPLHYFFYAGFHPDRLDELGLSKKLSMGIFLRLDPKQPAASLDDKIWDRVFQLAAWEDLPVVINGNNENSLEEFKPFLHKKSILERAIGYTEKHSARLYVLNVANHTEINLINEARKRTLLVYAETTPEHLFQTDETEANYLWQALKGKEIETIGSGYFADKDDKLHLAFLGGNFNRLDPSFLLPRLLNAYHAGKISLERIVEATRLNISELFRIEKNEDVVLVDLEEENAIEMRGGKTPGEQKIKGWPIYTIVGGHIFTHPKSGYELVRVD